MQEALKARFTDKELKLAASLGQGDSPLRAKLESFFTELSDPLVTADELKELLAVPSDKSEITTCLDQMIAASFLEKSENTQRPLDDEGTVLFRKQDVPVTRLKILGTASQLNDQSTRYQFTIDGRLIRSFARVQRLDAIAGTGS